MNELIRSIKIFCIFSVLLGIVYPLFITVIAQIVFPNRANGSLVYTGNTVIGSELIGQNFDRPEYFNSRPSAVDYNAQGSGGSNYGPTNKKLIERVGTQINKIKAENNLDPDFKIPADMVLTSSSGLDPNISVENARIQAKRISKIRNIPEDTIKNLIEKYIDPDFLGLWGQPGINILKLNIALDKISKK